jgi:hypothetical protein
LQKIIKPNNLVLAATDSRPRALLTIGIQRTLGLINRRFRDPRKSAKIGDKNNGDLDIQRPAWNPGEKTPASEFGKESPSRLSRR